MRLFPALLLAILLPACSYLTPYKLDVPQGNPVTADQVAKLKLGMTRTQVRFVMGTPLLTDAFHQNRWDYLFQDGKDGKVNTDKRFHVLFDGDRLIGMGGDTLPARARVAELAPEDPRAAAKANQSKDQPQ